MGDFIADGQRLDRWVISQCPEKDDVPNFGLHLRSGGHFTVAQK
jgi:hypothetical protein